MHLCKAYHFLSRISADSGTVPCSHNKPAPSPPQGIDARLIALYALKLSGTCVIAWITAMASMITKVESTEEGNTGTFLSSSLVKTALFVFASGDPLSAAKDQGSWCTNKSLIYLAIPIWNLTNNKKSGDEISVCLENYIPATCLRGFGFHCICKRLQLQFGEGVEGGICQDLLPRY
ncbi:hypothetical protein ACROYT_G023017 [Oculina patagonica]